MIVIGEKINGTIPSVGEAIAQKNMAFIRDLALKQSEAGADYIDVCAGVTPDIELETLDLLLTRQLNGADVILLNKTDKVSGETKNRILRELASLNPNARLFAASARKDSLSTIWEAILPDTESATAQEAFLT